MPDDARVILTDPFPHLWLDAGLPADLYARALALWPKVPSRDLLKNRMNWTTPASGPWAEVAAYGAEVMTPWILDLFADDIAIHRAQVGQQAPYTPEIASQPLRSNRGRWMARRHGYLLKPHVDVAPFFVTVLHYFAVTADEKDGTRLYRAERPLPETVWQAPRTQYFAAYDIPTTLTKICPWTPNGCLIFPNRLDAAHGNLVCGPRWRCAYQWHIALPEAEPGQVYQQTVLGLEVKGPRTPKSLTE